MLQQPQPLLSPKSIRLRLYCAAPHSDSGGLELCDPSSRWFQLALVPLLVQLTVATCHSEPQSEAPLESREDLQGLESMSGSVGRNLAILELRPARQKPSADSSNGLVAKKWRPKTRARWNMASTNAVPPPLRCRLPIWLRHSPRPLHRRETVAGDAGYALLDSDHFLGGLDASQLEVAQMLLDELVFGRGFQMHAACLADAPGGHHRLAGHSLLP